jgi:hypothetical protein
VEEYSDSRGTSRCVVTSLDRVSSRRRAQLAVVRRNYADAVGALAEDGAPRYRRVGDALTCVVRYIGGDLLPTPGGEGSSGGFRREA